MKKLLIQVVSVFTLVFGTSYQSVLALADDRSRTELSGVQLSDSNGNKARQVKVNETNNLEMTVTVNNKDGENADGKADMWLPEDQLKVMQEQVKAESAVTDTNATLIFERRKNNQPQLEWKNVETSATFKLKVPVQFTSPMTSMTLPIALGSQREYLQPLAAVSENATEEEMKEAGTPTDLPANMVQSLTSFIDAQNAQEAAQQAQEAQQPEQNAEAEAPAKDENKDKAKEDAAKEEAEAKRDAEVKAKQEAEDKKKEDEKTADTLKKNTRTANAESEKDGVERESNDKKETRAATDLGELLAEKHGVNSSLFNTVSIERNGQTTELKPNEPLDVSNLTDFTVHYSWDSDTLLDKLGDYDVKDGDFYTFKVYGLKDFKGDKDEGVIEHDGEEFAAWKLTPGSDSRGDYQEIRIEFTNEKMNATKVDYRLSLAQEYSGSGPIDFEYNGESTWTVDPIETKSMLDKSGKFIGNQQIEWTIDLTNDSDDMKFSDLVLDDFINTQGTNHRFVKGSWKAVDTDTDENVTTKFTDSYSNNDNQLTLKGNDDSKVGKHIRFTIITSYEDADKDDENIPNTAANGEFWNVAGGKIGENINMERVSAHVENTKLSKKAPNYNPETGIYSWEAKIDVDLEQLGSKEQAIELLQNMTLTDTLTGSHEFDEDNLNLVIHIGDWKVADRDIKKEVSDKKLTIKPAEGVASALYNRLKENSTITLTYDTKETAGQVGSVRNSLNLELDGGASHVTVPGQGGGLVVKDGKLSRDVHEDNQAHINWTITANSGKRVFTTLKVVDVLPEGIDYDDVKNIKVNDTNLSTAGVTVSEGIVKNFTKDGPYDFSLEKNKTDRKALEFTFDSNFSGKEIKITFETVHKWGSNSHTNYVGATTEDGRYEYNNKKVTIPDNIRDGSAKSGELNLDQEKGAKGNNYVTWKVEFGSHLNHYFGNGVDQTNKVTITDTLNADGAQYLKFSDSGYKLYALNNEGSDRDPALVPEDEYKLTYDTVNDNQRVFTIEFNDKSNGKKYTNFRLEFNTPIDFDAWQKGDVEATEIPGTFYFWNKAQVSYAGIDLAEVGKHVSLNSRGIYGQKTGKFDGTNVIAWELLMNAYGTDIGYPEITDTLSPGQMHSVDPDDLELAFVTPKFTANGDDFNVEVDPDRREVKLVNGEDYEVTYDSNREMTIKLKTRVDQPLVIRYKSIMLEQHALYTNTAKISAGSHSTEYTGRRTLEGSAFMSSWGVRFHKVDGKTDKALPGATFQLQQKVGNGDWEPARRMDNDQPYEPTVSNLEGYIQYHMLGTRAKYRIVEVSPPENYSGQMAPLEFDKKSAEEAGWDKAAHEIPNYPTIPGDLTISKATKKLENTNRFNFVVRAVDKDGNVNTGLQGTYEIKEGGEVTFHNGVSETISVPANGERTIRRLPIEKVDANGKTTTQYYDVRETSTSDDYTTQIAVDNEDPIWGKQTQPFELNESTAVPVTIFFTNTAAKGDLVISKTVSSEVKDELDASYKFTVEADDKDKVRGNTYKAEGAGLEDLTFNNDGKATFELKDRQQVKVSGLPEGVEFTVTEEATGMETTWSINGGNYTNDTDKNSVTINPERVQDMDFKNSSTKKGQLRITKQIEGNIPANEVFKFEIKADSKVDGEYPYATYAGSEQQPDTTGMVKFENGIASLTLKGGDYVRINNLPLGEEFAVREIDPDDKDIQTTWQIGNSTSDDREADPITLKNENDLVNVRFTNKLPNGSLTLNKEVLNLLPGDQSIRFDFNIEAVKADVSKVAGKTFTVEDNYNQRENITFNDEGRASLQLRHDQSVKILGLPAGIHLKISEEKHSDFNMSYDVVGDEDADEDSDGPTVIVPDNKNVSVNYANDRSTGNLLLEKQAEGSYPTNKSINFTIKSIDNDQLKDDFDADLVQADGTTISKKVNFDNGSADTTIQPGEKLLVKHLPEGKYQVTEEKQDDVVTTTWSVDGKNGSGLVTDDVSVANKDTVHVRFTNKINAGNLTIRKTAKNLENINSYKFEIRAVDKDGKVNTDFKGTYKLQEGGEVTFEDGVSEEITIPADGARTITGLPLESGSQSDQYYDVRETSTSPDYTTQISVGDDDPVSGKKTDPFKLNSSTASSVAVYFNNTAAKGDLIVSKTVSSEVKDELEGKYNFTIKADQKYKVANKEYDTEGTGGDKLKFDNDGEATFELTNNQQLKVKGLPEGVEFTVTEGPTDTGMETTWSVNGSDYTNGNNSVTIDTDKTQTIDFKNSSTKTGQLQITKRITGSIAADEEFKFEITADSKVDGQYPYAKYNVSNQHPGPAGMIDFEDGKATLTLTGDEYVRIGNLPLRQELKVREIVPEDSDIETTWQTGNTTGEGSDPATITLRDDNEIVNVRFTNALPNGSLTLNKKVMNQLPGDNVTPFTFTIAGVNDGDVNKVKNRTFTVQGDNGMDDISFNDNGQANLKLSHNQSVKILGLPAGVHLRITEDNHPNFNATYNVGGGEEADDADGPTVTVPDDKNVSVNYTNTRTKSGSLLLEKQAEGSYPTGDAIDFTIEALDANEDLDDEFSAALRQTDGTTLNKKVEFNGGKADVSIKPGEKLEMNNLPLGEYQVTEEDQDNLVTTTWKVDNKSGNGLVADDATVKDKETTHVLFTNKIANGSLELNKKVLNPLPGDQDTEFTFTIQATTDDISKVAGETYVVETNFNGRDNLKFNTEGQATLKLSHNQSVKVLGLSAGVQLKISEEQHSDFNVSYTVNGDEDDDEDGPTVTIPDGKNVAVNYTNARPIYGSLMLQKRAEGSYPMDKGIKFTIEALDENQDLERKFDATLTHTNGTTTSQKVSFENGKAEVTILPGEQLLIQNLPTGQYQVTEERQNRLVTTTWDIGTTQGNREKAAPVTVGEGDTAHVRFTNKIATGKLELNKSVASHDDADKGKDYKFEIRASRSTRWMVANKSYDVSGHSETKRIEFDRSGRAEVILKGGQMMTVSGLPEGVRLAVIETDSNELKATWNVNSEGSYQELSQRNRPNVTITEDQTEVVSYRNVRDPVGSLRVDKIVKGAYTDDHRKFEFTVDAQKIADKDSNDEDTEDADDTDEWITNEEFNGKYNVKVYSRSNNELQENSQVEFTNGQATLELKADQYAVIEGLPLNDDEQFQVSEVDPDIVNMTTTWAKNNGSPETGLVAAPVTLDETNVPRITFTNNLETGNLVLDKKLSGDISDTDRNRAFEFTVDAQVEDTETGEWKTDETFTGDYTATKTTADGRQTTSNVTFETGQLRVALKGGERLQISNLPTNMHMVISETPDGDYETSHQINHGSEMPGTTTDLITISNGSDQAVTFINDRPAQPQTAWLSLTKSVIGENGERDRGFEFNIRFLDDQMNPLAGTVDVVMTTPLGEHIASQMMLDMDGSSSFTLMDGETIRWNVPNGTHYQITESDYSADGYQTSVSQGQAPEREGLTATGVVMTNDPGSAKVVYYNRAVTPPEEEPHTPEEPDTTVPGFVPPASESGTGVGTSTDGSMAGSGGSTAPQAHTSGTSGSGTAAKGFLPQTGEWMKQNWLLLLGLVILLSTIGLMIRAKRKKS